MQYHCITGNTVIKFNCIEDLEDLDKTSLLFYSDTEIANLIVGDVMLSLMVRGEVTIDYKGERYKNYGQYSEELKELLRSNTEWSINEDLDLIDNNWFNYEIFKRVKTDKSKKQWEFIEDDCDNAEFNFTDSKMLYKEMIDYIKMLN